MSLAAVFISGESIEGCDCWQYALPLKCQNGLWRIGVIAKPGTRYQIFSCPAQFGISHFMCYISSYCQRRVATENLRESSPISFFHSNIFASHSRARNSISFAEKELNGLYEYLRESDITPPSSLEDGLHFADPRHAFEALSRILGQGVYVKSLGLGRPSDPLHFGQSGVNRFYGFSSMPQQPRYGLFDSALVLKFAPEARLSSAPTSFHCHIWVTHNLCERRLYLVQRGPRTCDQHMLNTQGTWFHLQIWRDDELGLYTAHCNVCLYPIHKTLVHCLVRSFFF